MAADFIGVTVLVTLQDPPGAKVQGLVTNVIAQQLTLSKVNWLLTGESSDSLIVEGSNIIDLEIQTQVKKPQTPGRQPFIDPAIVSYGRQDPPSHHSTSKTRSNGTPSKPHAPEHTSQGGPGFPPKASNAIAEPKPAVPIHGFQRALSPAVSIALENSTPSATLSGPFDNLSLASLANQRELDSKTKEKELIQPYGALTTGENETIPAQSTKKRLKRGGQNTGTYKKEGKTASTVTNSLAGVEEHVTLKSTPKRGRRSGWRQTPLTESSPMKDLQSSPQVNEKDLSPTVPKVHYPEPIKRISKLRRRRYRESDYDEQNGWATGEATDIQDMGDFDFEENLSKFDKRKVFEEIRQEDNTADEDRLVSLNRLPARPGTAGGKNLHFTEMVLDSPKTKDLHHSSEDSDLEMRANRVSNSRSPHRALSRASIRNAPSRKGSAPAAGDSHMTGSGSLPDITESRSRRNIHNRFQSPQLTRDTSTRSRKSSAQCQSSLRIVPSGRTCPCVSPLQMLELEQLATAELDMTEDMMTENAARGIAQAALDVALTQEAGTAKHNISPLIVILIGNNKTGSRAVAASRHLRNHGSRAVLCVLGLEREAEFLDSVRRQLRIFRNCGGRVIKQDQLTRTLRALHAPTDLIVDAMLGMHSHFDELRIDDQAAYFELVCWANGSDVDIMAIDVPSGIDAASGEAAVHDDTGLVVNASHVLSLGAPKTGLLIALGRKENFKDHQNLLVADIGISNTAWKKFGTRSRHGVDFGSEWVATLQYLPLGPG